MVSDDKNEIKNDFSRCSSSTLVIPKEAKLEHQRVASSCRKVRLKFVRVRLRLRSTDTHTCTGPTRIDQNHLEPSPKVWRESWSFAIKEAHEFPLEMRVTLFNSHFPVAFQIDTAMTVTRLHPSTRWRGYVISPMGCVKNPKRDEAGGGLKNAPAICCCDVDLLCNLPYTRGHTIRERITPWFVSKL